MNFLMIVRCRKILQMRDSIPSNRCREAVDITIVPLTISIYYLDHILAIHCSRNRSLLIWRKVFWHWLRTAFKRLLGRYYRRSVFFAVIYSRHRWIGIRRQMHLDLWLRKIANLFRLNYFKFHARDTADGLLHDQGWRLWLKSACQVVPIFFKIHVPLSRLLIYKLLE